MVKGEAGLLLWCQKICSPKDVRVTDFGRCWRDGRAFACLISHYHPDLLSYPLDDEKDTDDACIERLRASFNAAAKLGVARVLDPADVLRAADARCISLYVAYLYHALRLGRAPPKWDGLEKVDLGPSYEQPAELNRKIRVPRQEVELEGPEQRVVIRESPSPQPLRPHDQEASMPSSYHAVFVANDVFVPASPSSPYRPAHYTPQAEQMFLTPSRSPMVSADSPTREQEFYTPSAHLLPRSPIPSVPYKKVVEKGHCQACAKKLHRVDVIKDTEDGVYHATCFTCCECGVRLQPRAYAMEDERLYCPRHHRLLLAQFEPPPEPDSPYAFLLPAPGTPGTAESTVLARSAPEKKVEMAPVTFRADRAHMSVLDRIDAVIDKLDVDRNGLLDRMETRRMLEVLGRRDEEAVHWAEEITRDGGAPLHDMRLLFLDTISRSGLRVMDSIEEATGLV